MPRRSKKAEEQALVDGFQRLLDSLGADEFEVVFVDDPLPKPRKKKVAPKKAKKKVGKK